MVPRFQKPNFKLESASYNQPPPDRDPEDDETVLDNTPPIFSKYGDFHTIDWQRDLARDRMR